MTKKYTKDHEWLQLDGDIVTIGITQHAAEALGELVYVELPIVGNSYNAGDAFAVVESSKSASDVYIPVTGEVIDVNQLLTSEPELVNNSTYENGWIAKVKVGNIAEIGDTMSESEYNQFIKDNN